jgi:hypothetical protein
MAKIPAKRLSAKALRKVSAIRAFLWKHRKLLLEGTFVAIDPSCVSSSSKPGYAIFSKGEFVEQGILDVPYRPDLAFRLQGIRQLIQEEIDPYVDLVIIEETPIRPIRTKASAGREGKSFMNFAAISSQKQACGTTKSAFKWGKPVIELSAMIWHAVADRQGWHISKEDSDDARLIGETALFLLREILVKGAK